MPERLAPIINRRLSPTFLIATPLQTEGSWTKQSSDNFLLEKEILLTIIVLREEVEFDDGETYGARRAEG